MNWFLFPQCYPVLKLQLRRIGKELYQRLLLQTPQTRPNLDWQHFRPDHRQQMPLKIQIENFDLELRLLHHHQ